MDGLEVRARVSVATRMSVGAQAFLASLNREQLGVARQDFDDNQERERWFYTPTDHGGLTIREMNAGQQRLAMQLLATGLSEAGFNTAATIMGLEAVLENVEGHGSGFGHDRARDPGRYYVRIFGDPTDHSWGWRFGGHHISVNHTIIDGALGAGTPSFFGADPASSPLLGPHMLRPLGGLVDAAYDFVELLDPQQQAHAIVATAPPSDTVTGNRSSIHLADDQYLEPLTLAEVWRERFDEPFNTQLADATTAAHHHLGFGPTERTALRLSTTPSGLAVPDMTTAQIAILSGLIEQYTERLPDPIADLELAKITGDNFDMLHFAWAGATKRGEPMYYRIQGNSILIELDNTQRDANHIHAVWRNPSADFGRDLIAEHYRDHNHHDPGQRDHATETP